MAAWNFVARAIRPAEMIWNLFFPADIKVALSRDARAGLPAPQLHSDFHDPPLCGKQHSWQPAVHIDIIADTVA